MKNYSIHARIIMTAMVGIIGGLVSLNMTFLPVWVPNLIIMIGYALFALFMELKQYNLKYITFKHAIIYIIACNVGMWIPLLTISYGTYVGNVLRP